MRSFFQKFLICNSILLLIGVFVGVSFACNCLNDETVDKKFVESSNVAVLKLQMVKETDEGENYSLSVEKVFKGDLKTGEMLTFGPGTSCSQPFNQAEIGTEFLLYLDKRPAFSKLWIASSCNRSGPSKSSTADLLYLEKEKKMRGKTRLSGTIEKMIETPLEAKRFSIFPLANQKIHITGKGKSLDLVTDENGVYETYELPPGKYRVATEKIDGYTFSSLGVNYQDVEITAGNHTEQNFYFDISNGVSGKVIDVNGKPLENVCIALVPSREENIRNYSKDTNTNKKGEFEFSFIPVGNYWIVINKEGKITQNQLFNTFYYPNVKNKEEAAEISVGPNYFLKDLILVPPGIVETVTLSGTLIFADGKPAANKMVQFMKGEEISESSPININLEFNVTTDPKGQFTLKIVKGQAGILRGSWFTYLGEYENCPEIDEVFKQKGGQIQQINTADLNIAATQNLTGIELKFPVPSCKKTIK